VAPNSPYLNPVAYNMWVLLQEKVYKIRIADLNELKQRLRTEWAQLGYVILAAAIRQWRSWQLQTRRQTDARGEPNAFGGGIQIFKGVPRLPDPVLG